MADSSVGYDAALPQKGNTNERHMVVVAQLVRASVCGTEGRGFESHLPPTFKKSQTWSGFFCGLMFFPCPSR